MLAIRKFLKLLNWLHYSDLKAMSIHNIHSVGAQCTTVDLHHLLSVGVTHSHTAQINLKPKASKPSFKKYVQQVLSAQDKVWYVFTKTHFVCREKHTHRSFSTKTKNAHMSPSFFQNTDEPVHFFTSESIYRLWSSG